MLKNLRKTYRRNNNHPWQTIGEQTVILSTEGMMSYELSGVGYYIWENLNGDNSLEEILELICQEFEVSPEVAQKDLIDFVSCLEEQELINCRT